MDLLNRPLIRRFIRFVIVGGSGIIVNSAVLWSLHDKQHLPLWFASPLAIAVAIFYNFILNDLWTWREYRTHRQFTFLNRLWRYYLSATLGALINYGLLLLLTHRFEMYYQIANLIGIAAGTFSNFTLSDRWVFKKFAYSDDTFTAGKKESADDKN